MGNLIRPAKGNITQAFGVVDDSYRLGYHPGTDIGWGNGREIYAVARAPIVYAGWGVPGWGLSSEHGIVIIQDLSEILGPGWLGIYCHLDEDDGIVVGSGTPVAGQHIANMGATGRVTAMHLHFELREGGDPNKPRDPMNYISTTIPAGQIVGTIDGPGTNAKGRTMFLARQEDNTGLGSGSVLLVSDSGSVVGVENPTDWNILAKLIREGGTGATPEFSQADIATIQRYVRKLSPQATALDPAVIEKAIKAALVGVKITADPAAIAAASAAAVESILADNFAAIPDAVALEQADRLDGANDGK